MSDYTFTTSDKHEAELWVCAHRMESIFSELECQVDDYLKEKNLGTKEKERLLCLKKILDL